MKLSEIKDQVIDAIDAGIAVQLVSPPGIGKSEFVEDLIKELSVRDGKEWGSSTMFLATQTPPDLIGYLFKAERKFGDGSTRSVTDPTMPLWLFTRQGKPVFEHERGILFLDEYGQGEADVKRASAELLLNRRIGPWELPRGWGVIAASNRAADRSGVTKEFDFVINRRMEIEITPDVNAWTDWALTRNISPLVVAFANQNSGVVFDGKVPEKQGPWCTPRSLVMADRLLSVKSKRGGQLPSDPTTMEAISGIIGAPAAAQLFAFVKLQQELPKYETIVAKPDDAKVPTKPDAQMLVCYYLAHRVSKDDATPIIKYIDRFPKEFAVTFVKAACKRDHSIVTVPGFQKWAQANASLMASIALVAK